MKNINGSEYRTKEEAAQACREFAAANPGTSFGNYAHSKVVRRETTEAERDEQQVNGNRWHALQVDVYLWEKLFADNPILKTNPELKGMWVRWK